MSSSRIEPDQVCARRVFWGSLVAIAVVAVMVFVLTFKVSRKEVDVRSGMERNSVFVCGFLLKREIRDTAFSRKWHKWWPSHNPAPAWRLVSENSFFQPISPHFLHHGTPSMLRESLMVAEAGDASDDENRKAISRILTLFAMDRVQDAQQIVDEWGGAVFVPGVTK